MRLRKEAMDALKAEITGELKAGDTLVVAGAIALEGTKHLAKIEYEALRAYFSDSFLKEASEPLQGEPSAFSRNKRMTDAR